MLMTIMIWSEHFITGIDELDAQHKWLVEEVNSFAEQLSHEDEVEAQSILPMLDSLEKYAEEHFHFEEELMRKGGICAEYFLHHQGIHATFSEDIVLMRKRVAQSGFMKACFLLRFMTSWLTFHVLTEDQFMVHQLRQIACGTSPSDAYASSQWNDQGAKIVLNDSVLDHFMEVTKQNRKLTLINNELCATKAELAQINRQLEDRVNKRTQELAGANAQLKSEQESLLAAMVQIKNVQCQLMHAEKMAAVGQLAAGVAHDINNPIGFVGSNLFSLTKYVDRLFSVIDAYEHTALALPITHPARVSAIKVVESAELEYLREDIPDLLDESKEGIFRVKNIVNNLKSFSHVGEDEWQDTDINHELDNTLSIVWNEIKYKAEVKKDYGKLPLITCITSQINQVLLNLLINATQAIKDMGSISLRTGMKNGCVLIEVEDSGVGIKPEDQKRIFEPFYTTKPVGKGTGLGLSIAWEIIRQHNGTIEVESQLGQGATFRVLLPVKQPHLGLSKEGE